MKMVTTELEGLKGVQGGTDVLSGQLQDSFPRVMNLASPGNNREAGVNHGCSSGERLDAGPPGLLRIATPAGPPTPGSVHRGSPSGSVG